MRVKFFTGPQCGLCDDAKALIAQLPESSKPKLEFLNIREDTQLYHLYGARIPVLKRTDNDDELGWPFDLEKLEQFLR
jgi:hypothetical protein